MSLGLLSALEVENKTKGKVVSSERTEYSIPWHPKRNSARTGPNRLEPVGTRLELSSGTGWNLAATGRAGTQRSSRRRDCVRRPHITSDKVNATQDSIKSHN